MKAGIGPRPPGGSASRLDLPRHGTDTPHHQRSALALGSSWRVEQVDDEIEHDDEQRVDDHGAHDEGVVAVERALDEVAADAGDAEDLLDDDGAADQLRAVAGPR